MEKQIETEFEEALKEKQFQVYYQPQFVLADMSISGAEALVRWVRKDGTMEFPNTFIPILEKSGDIIELDFYVLEEVLAQLKKWKDAGKNLISISVNFSGKHFNDKGIYQRIHWLTKKYGIEHQYISIEITESLLVSGIALVEQELEHLRKAGFSVAIDDFGTGYSSLSMLHDIQADVVKIDKSFLKGTNLEEEQEFISKMGELISSVKEEVVFEGIETLQQLEFLKECGFEYGQGFLYDRPMPIEMFEEKYME